MDLNEKGGHRASLFYSHIYHNYFVPDFTPTPIISPPAPQGFHFNINRSNDQKSLTSCINFNILFTMAEVNISKDLYGRIAVSFPYDSSIITKIKAALIQGLLRLLSGHEQRS